MRTILAILILSSALCAQWTNRTVSAPNLSPKEFAGMAYIPPLGKTYLLGGFTTPFAAPDRHMHVYDHANPGWTYEPLGNTPTSPSTLNRRGGHEMVWWASIGKLFVYGGQAGPGPATIHGPMLWDPLNPSAGWTTNVLQTGVIPDARQLFGMVYVPGVDRVYMIGGSFPGPTWHVRQTYLYEGQFTGPTTINWRELQPSGAAPRRLVGPDLSYDQNTGKLVLSGGICWPNPATCYNQIVYETPIPSGAQTTVAWSQVVAGGRFASGNAFGYGGVHQFFGLWLGSPNYEHRVFKWNPPNWAEQNVQSGPTPAGRYGAQCVFTGNEFFLFGGELPGGVTTLETWTWIPDTEGP